MIVMDVAGHSTTTQLNAIMRTLIITNDFVIPHGTFRILVQWFIVSIITSNILT